MTTIGVASSAHCTYSVCLLNRIKDLHDCQWSGGFPLVNDGSLCVNMRYVCGPSANHLCGTPHMSQYTTLTPPFPPSHHMHMHPSPSHITYPCLSLSHTTCTPAPSLHIHITPPPLLPHLPPNRGAMGRCMFLRVEIVNKGATSFVIFSEAANVPPPFRLENFSQVGCTNGKNPSWLGGVGHPECIHGLHKPNLE